AAHQADLQLGNSDCLTDLHVVFIWSSGRMQSLQYSDVVSNIASPPDRGLPRRLPRSRPLAEDAPGRPWLPPCRGLCCPGARGRACPRPAASTPGRSTASSSDLLTRGGRRGPLSRHTVNTYVRNVNLFLGWCRRQGQVGNVWDDLGLPLWRGR